MKKLIVSSLTSLLLLYCAIGTCQNEPRIIKDSVGDDGSYYIALNPVVYKPRITVSIENKKADTLYVYDKNYYEVASIPLQNEKFTDKLHVDNGYYHLIYGDDAIEIYVASNFNVNIYFDANDVENSLQFSGKGASENNYLHKKLVKEEALDRQLNPLIYGALDESDFLQATDSLKNAYKTLFQTYKKEVTPEFSYLEENYIEYEMRFRIARYEQVHGKIIGNRSFKVSEEFPDVYENATLFDDKLLEVPVYIFYNQKYIKNTFVKDELEDAVLGYVKHINKQDISQKFKEMLFYNYLITEDYFRQTKKLQEVNDIIKNSITDSYITFKVETYYNDLKEIQSGKMFPKCTFVDTDENEVGIEQFKGKIRCINFWSTESEFTIKETPYLKKLEEKYKNDVTFINVCISELKEDWSGFLAKNSVGGIQLFADAENASILINDYFVYTVPHFTLVDADGKILDNNVGRPSYGKLETKLKLAIDTARKK
jgi:hypothetical protein